MTDVVEQELAPWEPAVGAVPPPWWAAGLLMALARWPC